MQTKHEIERLLAAAGTSPNKKLGQNFLIDLNLIRFLLDHAAITSEDIVLEVGCGTGTLTESIAEKAGALVVVEYDRILYGITKARLESCQNVTMIHGDALKNKNAINEEAVNAIEKLRPNFKGRFMLVANLPYNIAASLMANLIVLEPTAEAMYVTIQKEVAQRMSAKPGDELYGILSILMNVCGEVKFLKKLPPSVFWPAPKVESAMVEFIRDETKIKQIKNMTVLREVISLFMGHRRKMLKACTKMATEELAKITDWISIFNKTQIDPEIRGEKLQPFDFVRLANTCWEHLQHSE